MILLDRLSDIQFYSGELAIVVATLIIAGRAAVRPGARLLEALS